MVLLNEKKAKDWKVRKTELKEKLKTKSDYLKELQTVFNSYIRARDKNKNCISCNRKLIGKFDAGHLYTVSGFPELRFNEDNVNGQCTHCNMHEHGAPLAYREGLIKRIGIERVEEMESLRNKQVHYSIEDLKDLIKIYKKKLKECATE